MRLQIRRLAREDINSAFDWYYGKDVDVGARFADEIEHVLGRIASNPEQFPVVHRDVRRALVRHFQYAVYFCVHASRIQVLAVPHQRQSPGLWKRRT
jgi:plasmid stabilization system protein ParE